MQVEEEKKLKLPITQYMEGVDQPHILAKNEMNFLIVILNCYSIIFISILKSQFGLN